ncbi:phosphate regulon transcriptional regulatory protein PhoB [Oxobacter pfennigii]|uniref:Stage 0 sporulation protein A homolog n=1 Tax=Oxobacter pfennigii TaxID=36849 RepID=A0A0P8WZ73_9CLOT|nr:response regulator transcription factor [Oxobacter pfennigii]KPU43771.1 phosphate regulon transcriptional regulatory protein PhoB [Oxobacter pfennigii]
MPKKILIVEDSRNITVITKMYLENHGFEVTTVSDGVSAIDTVFNSHPDLVLLDVLIPRMNGYLVAEALKLDTATKHIPVIVMSAKAQSDDIKKALELGVEDYLIKPFTPEELLDKIRHSLVEG